MLIPLLDPNIQPLERAAAALRAGKLVAFPTETVYGLGADAFNPLALAQVFAVKQRPHFDPLIVHVGERDWLVKLCRDIPPIAERLMDRFWPGPLTLVLPKLPAVPDLATSGLASVAVRMPSHPVALELIRLAGCPVAAPSANPFGRLSPTRAEHVQAAFSEGIEYIVDGGPCEVGVESTVLSLTGEIPFLLRAGGVSLEALEAVMGPVQKAGSALVPEAPGQLAHHYMPRTPMELVPMGNPPPIPVGRCGYLAFRTKPSDAGFAQVEVLSPSGNLTEAAAELFSALHRLDRAGLERVYAEAVPPQGLGLAIMDRLQKASHG